MKTFECWCEDNEDREDACEVRALDAEAAAERICQLKFAGWDYPRFIDGLCIAEPGSREIRRFDVEVETLPNFIPREIRVTPPKEGMPR